jgi:hypothetical protein
MLMLRGETSSTHSLSVVAKAHIQLKSNVGVQHHALAHPLERIVRNLQRQNTTEEFDSIFFIDGGFR